MIKQIIYGLISCCCCLAVAQPPVQPPTTAENNSVEKKSSINFDVVKSLDILNNVIKHLHRDYVEEIAPVPLMQVGVQSMLKTLDPYTTYISEQQVQDHQRFRLRSSQSIGVYFLQQAGRFVIREIADASDAQQRLKIGDVLVSINDIALAGKSLFAVQALLGGQLKTTVQVTVQRGTELLTFQVQRGLYERKSVFHYDTLINQVGYVHLQQFGLTAAKELNEAIDSLVAQGITSLVLDFRGNPGGLLDEALRMANYFLAQETVLMSSQGRHLSLNETYRAQEAPLYETMPLVILLNKQSASASEVVAGAIQDHDRGLIIGQTSFGKGLLQSVQPLAYETQIKITVARYHTPSGRCIQAIQYAQGDAQQAVQDSTKIFYTTNGRPVYGNGGITPDVLIGKDSTKIVDWLVEQHHLFNYVTNYCHKQAKLPRDFGTPAFERQLFLGFTEWLDQINVWDSMPALRELDRLEQTLPQVGTFTSDLDALRVKLRAHLRQTLRGSQSVVINRLYFEILRRYGKQSAALSQALLRDEAVIEAVRILQNPGTYHYLLQAIR